MRVMVFGTGRCGSTTFHRACKHITNYTASHEKYLVNMPDKHINVSCRLTWILPLLDQYYNRSDTYYVHLVRNQADTVRSWLRRGAVRGFGHFKKLVCPTWSNEGAAELCYNTMVAACEQFIETRNGMTVQLERIEDDFQSFFDDIEACGDVTAAIETFERRFNAS